MANKFSNVIGVRLIVAIVSLFLLGMALLYIIIIVTNKPVDEENSGKALDLRGSYQTLLSYPIDGDTVVLNNGNRIRLVGIDSPELGKPFSKKAKIRIQELVEGEKLIHVDECSEERTDKYGRILGWISVGGLDIGEVLLKEGLAETLVIPPCGNHKKDIYSQFEKEAKDAKLGIWSTKSK